MATLLDETTMLGQGYEPKRKFRWLLSINGLDAFVLKTAARPQMTFEETVIDYINTKRYVAGKMSYNTIAITMHDPIAPSAAQKVMAWVRRCYEVQTGRAGYQDFYKQDISLKLLDPQGAVVEEWALNGAWVQDSNFGDLDYATSDNVEINAVLRYDAAKLLY